jgi:CheY-like chemotaxis protein
VRLLKLLGNDAVAVYDGRDAVDTARTFKPDYVLLDIGLPGMNGYDVAAALRAEKTLGDPVIVAVSGYGQEEDRRRSFAAGFDHHLVKPVDLESLAELIGRQD